MMPRHSWNDTLLKSSGATLGIDRYFIDAPYIDVPWTEWLTHIVAHGCSQDPMNRAGAWVLVYAFYGIVDRYRKRQARHVYDPRFAEKIVLHMSKVKPLWKALSPTWMSDSLDIADKQGLDDVLAASAKASAHDDVDIRAFIASVSWPRTQCKDSLEVDPEMESRDKGLLSTLKRHSVRGESEAGLFDHFHVRRAIGDQGPGGQPKRFSILRRRDTESSSRHSRCPIQ